MVFAKFLLELRLPAPGCVLPPIVGKKLLRNPVFPDRPPVCLEHVLGALTPVHSQPCNEPGVVIDEPDDIGVFAQEFEDRDVALPELIRLAVLEPAVLGMLFPALLLRRRRQPFCLHVSLNCRGARPHEEEPPQYLRYPPRPMRRIGLLQLPDLLDYCRGEPLLRTPWLLVVQTGIPVLPILPCPVLHGRIGDPQLLRHQPYRDPFLDVKLYGLAPYHVPVSCMPHCPLAARPRSPPRGRGGGTSYCLLLLTHGFTPCHALTASGVLPSFTHSSFSLSGR